MPASGDWTLTRAASGQAGVLIGTGTTTATGAFFFLDAGDGLTGPLLPTSPYTYTFTAPDGAVSTPPLMPVSSVVLDHDPMTHVFIRMLQGAFAAVTLPDGIKAPNVGHAMPLVGFPVMPFVVVYPELLQQEEVPIGGDVPQPDDTNIWQKHEVVRRVYRVSVLSTNAKEREFLRDVVIAVFRSSLAYFLDAVGQDMRQRWQASNYQVSAQTQLQVPGFYGADIMLDFSGVYNLTITTNYGVIQEIQAAAAAGMQYVGEPQTISVQVPAASG